MVNLKQVIHRYCDETTIHGIRDLFYAKFLLTKLFWALVIIGLATITIIQIYNVIDNFVSEPTKTEITLLPANIPPKYPPYVLQPLYFTDWLDYEKMERMDFDLETILYAMSHFGFVYTKIEVNVERAKKKMERIMRRNKLATVYDLGMALSLPTLPRIKPDPKIKLSRYFSIFGGIKYIDFMDQSTSNNSNEDDFSHKIVFNSFTNFERSEVHRAFLRLFNHSLAEEYGLFKQSETGDQAIGENKLKTPLPINFNVASDKNTYSYVNVFLNTYEFYLKGNLYKWIPRKDKACRETAEAKFYEECEMECTYKHRPLNLSLCALVIVPQNYTQSEHSLEKACKFEDDESLWQPDDYKECFTDCMSSCNKWNYQFSSVVSANQIDSENDALYVQGEITLTYTEKENMLLISLLPSVTWENAVANVGGLLGLWLGGSVMSFIQIIYFLCWYPLEVWISSKWRKKKKNEALDYIQQSLMSSKRKSVAYNNQLGLYSGVACGLQNEMNVIRAELDDMKAQLSRLSSKSDEMMRQNHVK